MNIQEARSLNIDNLPMLSSIIDSMMPAMFSQAQDLKVASAIPGVFSKADITDLDAFYTEQLELLALYAELLSSWKEEPISEDQEDEICRLELMLKPILLNTRAGSALINNLKSATQSEEVQCH